MPSTTAAPPALRERILEATIACIAGTGVAKTTIDDIARAANCGRATVYRSFAGGRDAILAAAAGREVERLLADLGTTLDACDDLEEAVVTGISTLTRMLHDHDALRFVATNEPSVLRPLLSFDGLDPVLARAAVVGEAHLGRFLPVDQARAVGEWAARLIVSYVCDPFPTGSPFDLRDETVTRGLVRTFGPAYLAGDAVLAPLSTSSRP